MKRPPMKSLVRAIVAVAASGLLAAYALASIVIGSPRWPIDILSSELDCVTSLNVPGQGRVGVFQEWNGGDFYNTYLIHVDEESQRWVHLLDPDNSRLSGSTVRLAMQDDTHVTVHFGDRESAVYGLHHHELDHLHGGIVYPNGFSKFPLRKLPVWP